MLCYAVWNEQKVAEARAAAEEKRRQQEEARAAAAEERRRRQEEAQQARAEAAQAARRKQVGMSRKGEGGREGGRCVLHCDCCGGWQSAATAYALWCAVRIRQQLPGGVLSTFVERGRSLR